MAGMLPGVECARRRRFHQSSGSGWPDSPATASAGYVSTRRSSFCLYTTNHEPHLGSVSFTQRNMIRQAYLDEKLSDEAREAKVRLDERLKLRPPTKSETTRSEVSNGQGGSRNVEEGVSLGQWGVQMEVLGLKKGGPKRFSWTKLRWKSSEQEDCAVCLEQFKAGETLMHLPCAHRFHSKCLAPWLHNHARCPCCRIQILKYS